MSNERGGGNEWSATALRFERLVRLAPTFGALVGRAAAVGHGRSPAARHALLGAMPLMP
jgi:RNA polymerase sigma-70 factor (ECF subfamily)